MRIIVIGDVHMDLGNFASIPEVDTADLIIINGDLTNYGNQQDAHQIITAVSAINNQVVAMPGNLDQPDVADYLAAENKSLHGRGQLFGDIGLLGVGGSNYTPFHTPLEYSEKELKDFLTAGFKQVKGAVQYILISHTPPVNTKTDRIMSGAHVGSSAIRLFIEEKQPALCLCGHIHEAKAVDRIGNTQIINPGMIKDGGWIEVLLDNEKIQATLHTC